jgi:hypothetical protein
VPPVASFFFFFIQQLGHVIMFFQIIRVDRSKRKLQQGCARQGNSEPNHALVHFICIVCPFLSSLCMELEDIEKKNTPKSTNLGT